MLCNFKNGFWKLFFFFCLAIFNVYAEKTELVVPNTIEGAPAAGKRVRVYLDAYPKAYYTLYLPQNFVDSEKFPVIFESPGNGSKPEGCCLGYGISKGMDYIWVSVPIVGEEGQIFGSYWGPKKPSFAAEFWLAVLEDLNQKFNIDNDRIILSGFSRGAISTIYVGNYNEVISSKWAAYFAHAHFDGCCVNIDVGNFDDRMSRIQNKPVLISVGEKEEARVCSYKAYMKLLARGHSVTYIEIPKLPHQAWWILKESEEAQKARDWLKELFH